MPKIDAKTRLKRFEHKNAWEAFLNFNKIFFFFFAYLRHHKLKALLMVISNSIAGPIWLVNAIITKLLIDDSVLAECIRATRTESGLKNQHYC